MANDLTGNFDVVAEITVLAADRVLAAMHRCERLLHSISIRVDDTPPRQFPPRSVITGVLDSLGDVVANQRQIRNPTQLGGTLVATDARYVGSDILVNSGEAVVVPITPSNLKGVAQLQLDPPTIQVPDASGKNLVLQMGVRARYFPDPNTSPAAQFVRGQLIISAPVSQVASQSGNLNVIRVDVSGPNVNVTFNSLFSSPALSAADLAGINQLVRNALKTGFLPSNTTLPDPIRFLQFKTVLGTPSVIGVLLNLDGSKGNPATVSNLFLGSGDDFGVAISSDFVLQKFKEQLTFQVPSISFLSYHVTINPPTIELQSEQIVLKVSGHAHSTPLPDFNFTISQAFVLKLAASSAGGTFDTADLVASGDFSVDVSGLSFLFDWVADDFIGWFLGPLRSQRDSLLLSHRQDVRDMFSVNKILGKFLQSLLNQPQSQAGAPPQQDVNIALSYRSVEIRPSGIVLHGSLGVTAWPAPHLEYQPIPVNTTGPGGSNNTTLPHGPDYTALKTWIPGGAITQYEWSYRGQSQPFVTDINRFVLQGRGAVVSEPAELAFSGVVSGVLSGYEPLCLTVKGSRLSSSGLVVSQPVTATVCGYNSFPVVNGLNLPVEGLQAMVALTQEGPGGVVQVVGHTPALAHIDKAGKFTPNVIVHFADEKSSANLDFLLEAVKESGRKDAAIAVLALLTSEQLTKARHTLGLIYGDRHGGAWERVFRLKTTSHSAHTLIVSPNGKIAWQQQGPVDNKTLAAALKANLAAGGSANRGFLRLNLTVGRKAPNFLFQLATERGLTLRKLESRAVILVFWKSSSKASMDAVRDLQEIAGKSARSGSTVLAINDGESVEAATKAAETHKFAAILVTDPQRQISSAYGVSVWPTTVSIDAGGIVTAIRYGRAIRDTVAAPTGTETNASR
ncbi:MAG: TlpA disulfide reductase family protein [Candidatus Acidiferrum sp.]